MSIRHFDSRSLPLPQVFDWFLTLDLEVSLVWSSPWSGMKVLFLLTRYLPFVDISVLTYCELYFPVHMDLIATSFTHKTWLQLNLLTHFLNMCAKYPMNMLPVSRAFGWCNNGRLSYLGLTRDIRHWPRSCSTYVLTSHSFIHFFLLILLQWFWRPERGPFVERARNRCMDYLARSL